MNRKIKVQSIFLGVFCLITISVFANTDEYNSVSNKSFQNSNNDIQQLNKLIKDGEWAEAYAVSNRIIINTPKSPIALFVRSTSRQVVLLESQAGETLSPYSYPFSEYVASQNLKQWIDSLLTTDNSNINFLILKGTYQAVGKQASEKAIITFEKILKLDPDNVFAMVSAGAFNGSNGQLDDAKRLLEKAIQLKSDCPSAYTNLGTIAMLDNNLMNAEEYFQKATSFKSADAMDWFNLGSFYYSQKKYQGARKALDKTVLLSPENVEAHMNLAGICYFLNDIQASKRHLKVIIEVGYNTPYYSVAKQNLKQLGGE